MPTPEFMGPRGYGVPVGLQRLHDYLLARFPTTRSGGMYNPASKTSGGSPSAHTVTQALDLMCDAQAGRALMMWAVANAETINLQQAICWHQIITAVRWAEGVRDYTPNDHAYGNGHLHLHVGWQAALKWMPPVDSAPSTPTPAAPAPPAISSKGDAMLTIWYLDYPHGFWIDKAGCLQHNYGPTATENMSTRYKILERYDPIHGVSGIVNPKTWGLAIRLVNITGQMIKWDFQANTGWSAGRCESAG